MAQVQLNEILQQAQVGRRSSIQPVLGKHQTLQRSQVAEAERNGAGESGVAGEGKNSERGPQRSNGSGDCCRQRLEAVVEGESFHTSELGKGGRNSGIGTARNEIGHWRNIAELELSDVQDVGGGIGSAHDSLRAGDTRVWEIRFPVVLVVHGAHNLVQNVQVGWICGLRCCCNGEGEEAEKVEEHGEQSSSRNARHCSESRDQLVIRKVHWKVVELRDWAEFSFERKRTRPREQTAMN